jgi:hypothetical protein
MMIHNIEVVPSPLIPRAKNMRSRLNPNLKHHVANHHLTISFNNTLTTAKHPIANPLQCLSPSSVRHIGSLSQLQRVASSHRSTKSHSSFALHPSRCSHDYRTYSARISRTQTFGLYHNHVFPEIITTSKQQPERPSPTPALAHAQP